MLSPDDFYTPDDPDELRRERDLLALENRLLRSRVDEQSSEKLRKATKEVERLRKEVSEMRGAHGDLRWLLKRMNHSVAGPVLRRYSGFRTLLERWLE